MTTPESSRFARYYRSRPLIGGALIVLSGLEIFLSTQLDLGNFHVQVGIEGFQAMIIPFALVTLGVLLIVDPAHRLFYGVISLAVSIYAVIGVNLGGFIIGTILGLVGGVVALSWIPRRDASASEDEPAAVDAADEPLELEVLIASAADDAPAAEETRELEPVAANSIESASEPPPFADRPAEAGPTSRRGMRTVAVVGALALAGVSFAGIQSQAAHAESPLCGGVLDVLCTDPTAPTPEPTATTDPTPAPQPEQTTAPEPEPAPVAPVKAPAAAEGLLAPQEADATVPVETSAPIVAAETSTLKASSLSQTNGRYVGTVALRRADGSTVRAMKILGDAGLLKDVRLHGSGDHAGAGIDADRLDVAGPIYFYAAAFSGKAYGAVPVQWDVDSPPPADVAMPPFTDVTVDLVYFQASGQTLTGSHISPR